MSARKVEAVRADEVQVGDKLITVEGAYLVTAVDPVEVGWVGGPVWGAAVRILTTVRGVVRFIGETVVVLR